MNKLFLEIIKNKNEACLIIITLSRLHLFVCSLIFTPLNFKHESFYTLCSVKSPWADVPCPRVSPLVAGWEEAQSIIVMRRKNQVSTINI